MGLANPGTEGSSAYPTNGQASSLNVHICCGFCCFLEHKAAPNAQRHPTSPSVCHGSNAAPWHPTSPNITQYHLAIAHPHCCRLPLQNFPVQPPLVLTWEWPAPKAPRRPMVQAQFTPGYGCGHSPECTSATKLARANPPSMPPHGSLSDPVPVAKPSFPAL